MKTIQLNIGRNSNENGKPITNKEWNVYKRKIETLASIYLGAEPVAKGTYNCEVWREESFFVTAKIPNDVPDEAFETFRKSLSFWAKAFQQDSIALSMFETNELIQAHK